MNRIYLISAICVVNCGLIFYFAAKENNNYNGSTIELPEEIDCATKGDTLIVIETVDERIIKIGYKR